jgi:hypothetical protein
MPMASVSRLTRPGRMVVEVPGDRLALDLDVDAGGR